jgi:hypothetical protein
MTVVRPSVRDKSATGDVVWARAKAAKYVPRKRRRLAAREFAFGRGETAVFIRDCSHHEDDADSKCFHPNGSSRKELKRRF